MPPKKSSSQQTLFACGETVLNSFFQSGAFLFLGEIPAWPFFGKPFFGTRQYCKSMQVSSHVVCSQFHKEFAVDVGCYHFLYDPGPEPPLSILQMKENFNSECQCHRIYDPWLFRSLLYHSRCSHCMYSPWMYDPWLSPLSPLQLKKYLQCKQVAVHRLLWHCMFDPSALFDCSSVKANVNGECTRWSLHVCPVASFNCLLSNSKTNLSA